MSEIEQIQIPNPPESLLTIDGGFDRFIPAPHINDFIEATILNEENELFNLEHIHLLQADIGFLWTNAKNVRRGRRIVGTAEMPIFRGDGWQKARQEMQMIDWFGKTPEFVITLDASFCATCQPVEFLAVLEHELYHCGQAVDEFGLPRFSRTTGKPIYTSRPHDVEEFTGVVRRYGIGATGQDRVDFVSAALCEPEIGRAHIEQLCGNCVD